MYLFAGFIALSHSIWAVAWLPCTLALPPSWPQTTPHLVAVAPPQAPRSRHIPGCTAVCTVACVSQPLASWFVAHILNPQVASAQRQAAEAAAQLAASRSECELYKQEIEVRAATECSTTFKARSSISDGANGDGCDCNRQGGSMARSRQG